MREITGYTEQFDRLVKTWERAYMVIMPTKKSLQKRLYELGEWDNSGTKIEHEAKEIALRNLITRLEKKQHKSSQS